MNEIVLADNVNLKKEKHWSWSISVFLALALLCIFTSIFIVLPKTIIYFFSGAIYPNSQNISSNSGVEPDVTLTKLLIYSKANFETTDNINQVYKWYIQYGWQEVSRNQGIALEKSRSVNLPIDYKLKIISSVGIVQSGQHSNIEISTSTFLFH